MKEYGQETECGDAFSFAAYQDSYVSPHRGGRHVGNYNAHSPFAYRQKLFRETKRRLEHGVPVNVLIRDVTLKLRMMKRGGAQ